MKVAVVLLVFVLGAVNAECDEADCIKISHGMGTCSNETDACECGGEYREVSRFGPMITCRRVFNATEFARAVGVAWLVLALIFVVMTVVAVIRYNKQIRNMFRVFL